MFKGVLAFIGLSLFSFSSFAGPTTLDCQTSSNFEQNLNEIEKVVNVADDCPPPTEDQYLAVCQAIYDKKVNRTSSNKTFPYVYEMKLWDLSCAKSTDELELAIPKIQQMWKKHKLSFTCNDFPDSEATEKNIAKFSAETGFSHFITEAIEKYKLDLNFKDPADNKTVLEFVKEQETNTLNRPPVDQGKVAEYKEIACRLEAAQKGEKFDREKCKKI